MTTKQQDLNFLKRWSTYYFNKILADLKQGQESLSIEEWKIASKAYHEDYKQYNYSLTKYLEVINSDKL